jgi:hypothetical protein
MPKQDTSAQNVITGKVRLSFAHVWEPYAFPGDTGDPKYSVMLLIPKTDHDGDEEGDLDKSPELEGHYYMNVSSKTKPGIVDQNVNPILDQTEVYSGCYARVSLFAFPYDFAGKKGVSFILKNIQKMADGEPFGSSSRAEDEFDQVADDDLL